MATTTFHVHLLASASAPSLSLGPTLGTVSSGDQMHHSAFPPSSVTVWRLSCSPEPTTFLLTFLTTAFTVFYTVFFCCTPSLIFFTLLSAAIHILYGVLYKFCWFIDWFKLLVRYFQECRCCRHNIGIILWYYTVTLSLCNLLGCCRRPRTCTFPDHSSLLTAHCFYWLRQLHTVRCKTNKNVILLLQHIATCQCAP